MNINDLEEIRIKLVKEYSENCSKIEDLEEKIRIINLNTFENKAMYAVAFSLIPWVVSMVLSIPIIQFGVIPLNLVQSLSVLIPIVSGITLEEFYCRKEKYLEKLKRFSKSKTQKEKLEETTRYEIEKEKLISSNEILEKCYCDLLAKEEIINSLLESYNISKKDTDYKSIDELTENINNINNILMNQQQNVNVATTRYVLNEKFGGVKNKFQRFFNTLKFGITGGVVYMIFHDLTAIVIRLQTSFIGILSPFIFSGLVFSGYYFKREKNRISIFKSINKELGDNAIPEFCDYEESMKYGEDLDKVINETYASRLQLETEKQTILDIIDQILEDSKQKRKNINKSPDEHTVKEELDKEITFNGEKITKEKLDIILDNIINQILEDSKQKRKNINESSLDEATEEELNKKITSAKEQISNEEYEITDEFIDKQLETYEKSSDAKKLELINNDSKNV